MRGFTSERRTKGSHAEWASYLLDADRQMTLDEFRAHELAMLHLLVADIHAAVGMHPGRGGGYFEQVRNLLSTFVGLVAKRPPPSGPLGHRPAELRLLPRDGESSEEGG